MIQIYKPENNKFDKNGDASLSPISCESTVTLNGSWEMELIVPATAELVSLVTENSVIKAPSPEFDNDQLWRIYAVDKDNDEIVAQAYPIFLDAKNDCTLVDVRPTGKTGQEALNIMCAANSKYTATTDITKASTAYYIRKNLIEAIGSDDEQSFINRWGGEVLYNNFNAVINERAGGDYGARAELGFNIQGIEEKIDMSEVVTRIIPESYNGYTLSGDKPWVDSPIINAYPTAFARVIQYSNIKLREDAQENDEENGSIICDTLEELRTALTKAAQQEYKNGIDEPHVEYKIDILDLESTREYKDFKDLVKIRLGDVVHVRHKRLGIDIEVRCIGRKYDHAAKRITEITLGNPENNYFDDVSNTIDRIGEVIDPDSGMLIAGMVKGFLDAVNTQLRLQSTVAKKVNGRAFEISDLDPESELYGCMIFGSQGLQIATERTADGRDWNWRTAITAKGIVADAIITGLLSDKTGRNYWNLDTGEFRLSSEAFLVDDDNIEEYVNKKLETVRNITMILGNEYQGIPTDYQGNYADFPIVQTTVQVLYGQIDVTASCQYTIQKSEGVTGAWDNTTKVYTVTDLTADTGWVDITAAYLGLFTVTKRFNIAKQKNGEPGAQGIPGKDGGNGTDGRTSYFHVMYAPNDKPTSSQMSKEPNSYIGTYVDFIETDSRDPLAYSWVKIEGVDGKDGTNGIPGKNGIDGKTSYLHIKYSDDGSTFTGNAGETPGKWMGQYVDFTPADSLTFSDYAWTKVQGPQGVQGPKGADGKQYYTWLKYADTPTSGMSDTPTGKAYIGLAYNKETATESNNYSDYTWSLVKGEKGDTGISGPKGADGKTYYTWLKYADNSSGSGMSDSPEGKSYIGLAYNKATEIESNNPADYVWSLIKGDKGDKGEQGIQGPVGPSGRSSYFFVRFSKNANGNPMTTSPNGAVYMGTAITETNTAPSSYTSYVWAKILGDDGAPGPQGEKGTPGAKGEDGQTPYLHIKYSNDGKTFTANNGETPGAWMGAYVDFTEADSTVFNSYVWKRIEGDKGDPGVAGRTSYFHVMYAPVDNPTTAQMSKEPDAFIGTYVDFTATDSRDPLAYSWVKIEGADGKDGTNGIPGTNGIDGKTSYIHMKYSDDGSTFTADNGETPGKWIGQYVDFVQADSTVFSDYVWTKIQGPQGIQGLKGADGKQYYTWLKYADTPTSGMSDDPTDKAYIGLAYNKESATESNNYNDYTWSLIKGEKGDTGVTGQNGADGKQLYTWVKYATSASGANMSDDPSGKTYIGLAYNKTTAAESTDASDYTWSLIKGDKGDTGAAGRTYFMEASTLVAKRSQDNSIAPNYITLSAYYRDGTGTARTGYAGRFKIEESLDGATWTTVYTSSANEPSITHSLYSALATSAGGVIATASGKAIGIPRDVVALRCTLYAAGGTTQMLDMQSIAVVVDVDALTHEDIFDLLTKNGSLQGIYMQGGQLYINGTYMRIGKIASKNGRVYFDLDNNVLACSKMVSADTGQSIQTVADVGYPAGTSSSSGSRLRVYPQGYEGSAIQIHADTSNKGYIEGPSERMDIKCADTKTVINMYPTYMKLSAYPEPGSSSAKYAQIGLYSTGSSYDTGHVEIKPRLDVKGPLKVAGTFTASGTKSRIVETENYSRRLQYCYEMATPMFGDLGEGVTDENGECCVSLDDVFAETVATGIEYQVFLQKEGPGDIWVGEKHPSYFIARGTENLKFAWEIKVKQKDFECMRLENADFEEDDVEAIFGVYEEEYAAEVAQIIEEQEGLFYETT